MYDIQVQGSEVTILLTLHSRFSAIFIGLPGSDAIREPSSSSPYWLRPRREVLSAIKQHRKLRAKT